VFWCPFGFLLMLFSPFCLFCEKAQGKPDGITITRDPIVFFQHGNGSPVLFIKVDRGLFLHGRSISNRHTFVKKFPLHPSLS
jgi:hypothetical protein